MVFSDRGAELTLFLDGDEPVVNIANKVNGVSIGLRLTERDLVHMRDMVNLMISEVGR
jgi:hypothetical protein